MLLLSGPSFAGYTVFEEGDSSLDISGDLRLRLEQDWDSKRGDGTERDDRLRMRGRARLRFDAQIDESWKAVLRIRSGSDDSQQSPHVTLYDFDDNDTGDADFNLDLWYGQYEANGWRISAGRNSFNLWRQDEYIFDDDVTALGMGITYVQDVGAGKLSYNGGFGSLPSGMRDFSGQYATAQVVYDLEKESYGLTVAGGYMGIDADPDDEDSAALLLTENSSRDYQTAALQAQLRIKTLDRPLKLALTAGHNFEDYDDEPVDSFSEFHKDDDDFYVLFATWGSAEKQGDWLLGYYYAYIEALALNSSYTEDDWVRWGNANQTRATNMKGSEFRLAYGLADSMNLVGRVMFVDAIELLNAGDTSKEDGKRARLDLNIKF